MPVNPLAAALMIGVGGTAAGTLPSLIGTGYERDQKRQLEALKKKEAAGTLGLTEEERSLMESRLSGPAQAQAAASQAQQRNLLAGSGASSGAALLGAQMAGEEAARARADVAAKIEEQNYAKKQEQLDQMALLEQAAGIKQAKRTAAIGAILQSGVDAVKETPGQTKFLTPSAALQSAQKQSDQVEKNAITQEIADKYGITFADAKYLTDAYYANPEVLNYYVMARGGK